MSRQRDTHRHLRGLSVTDLTEKDLLRILPERRAQSCDKRQPRLRVYLYLAHPIDAPLHRILERHDITAHIAERRNRRIERRRLARVHRSAEEEQPRRATNQAFKK